MANDIHLPAVKFALLDKWLPAAAVAGSAGSGAGDNQDLDETVSNFKLTFGPANGKAKDDDGGEDEDDVNFLRCAYLAQNEDREVLEYLVTVGFSNNPAIRLAVHFHSLFPT